jgi:GMP synthase (glutamine-hydrolysing)
MKPLAVIVAGEPSSPVEKAHGPFWWHVRRTVGPAWTGDWVLCDARTEKLPDADEVAGLIVTGSHASVTEQAPWMRNTAEWLRCMVDGGVPLLGLCFGHQLLGYALGGKVERHPGGPEYGTVPLEVFAADELLGPQQENIPYVNMLHEDTVIRLPPGATVLARTAHEPHAAVRFARRAWGVQFHPEFDGAIVRCYLSSMGAKGLRDGATDTPWSSAILRRFAGLAQS